MQLESTFRLYDLDGSGSITLDEMIRYLSAVFRIMYRLNPSQRAVSGGLSPEELARATAYQAFEDADVNRDRQLTFEVSLRAAVLPCQL